ncbi:MAG: TylF/MycF/NovP-related O-methyltransferase [Terriglobales bacterium]
MTILAPIKRLARAAGIESARNLVRPWEEEPFASDFAAIRGTTLVGPRRCYVLAALARQAAAVAGAMAEVGVYRGGTARLLARMRPDRRFYLFDTFAGMPPTDPARDRHRAGDFADTSLEAVRDFVGAENAVFRPGLFPDSAAGLESERFALVHVDCDIYPSVRACCEWFYPRLTMGGAMVFDDYGYTSCPGARQAVDEFFAAKPEQPILAAEGQALVFRLPA